MEGDSLRQQQACRFDGDESNEVVSYEEEERTEAMVLRRVSYFVVFGGLAWGLDLGAVSGALPSLASSFGASPSEIGFFVSIAAPGEVLGAAVAGTIGDLLGRRTCIFVCDSAFVSSSILLATATSLGQLYAGRFVAGFAAGSAIIAQVAWASEVAPAKRRGEATAALELALALGFLLSFGAYALFNESQILFALPAIPALIQLVALFFVPESPSWLSTRPGRADDANSTLERVYRQFAKGASPTKAAKASLKKVEVETQEVRQILWSWRVPFYMMIASTFFTFFTGGFNIRLFAVVLFDEAGASEKEAARALVGFGLVKLVTTAAAMRLIDKTGRRTLLLVSLGGMGFCAFSLSLFYISDVSFYFVLTALLFYSAFFQLGFGVCNFVLAGELFPPKLKGRLAACLKLPTALFQSSSQFLFALALERHLVTLFLGHALFCLIGFFLFEAALSETKHKDPFRIRSDLSSTTFANKISAFFLLFFRRGGSLLFLDEAATEENDPSTPTERRRIINIELVAAPSLV